jgi:hypothetical protein
MPMVSASLFLLDLDLQSEALLKFLGFDAPVSLVTLANQLLAFSKLYEASLQDRMHCTRSLFHFFTTNSLTSHFTSL